MLKEIQTPTNEFVNYYIKSFDKDNRISLTDKSISKRLSIGDKCTPIWTGSNLTSISFSDYDSKYFILFVL
jgi:hypothetical protein